MPEATEDAILLISTSYQAKKRALLFCDTELCDSTIAIVFAAFYIEANITYILQKMGRLDEIIKNPDKDHPGMMKKIKCFYQYFISPNNTLKVSDEDIYNFFPKFQEIHKFRNDVAHGKIDKSIAIGEQAEILREAAKNIVNMIIKISEERGITISKTHTYDVVIQSTTKEKLQQPHISRSS